MASGIVEIPLLSQNQTLQCTLAGTPYQLHVYWSQPAQLWHIDIADVNGNPIASGLPLAAGEDIFEELDYLDFGGSLYLITSGDPNAEATFSNLGDTANLYFVPDAVAA